MHRLKRTNVFVLPLHLGVVFATYSAQSLISPSVVRAAAIFYCPLESCRPFHNLNPRELLYFLFQSSLLKRRQLSCLHLWPATREAGRADTGSSQITPPPQPAWIIVPHTSVLPATTHRAPRQKCSHARTEHIGENQIWFPPF